MNLNLKRSCKALKQNGEPCKQTPLTDSEFCFWHDPSNAEAAAQAHALGGQNRKRERTLEEIYDIEGLETPAQLRRVLQIALDGELALENSHNRSRTLIAVVAAAVRLNEQGELARQLAEIQEVLGQRPQPDRKQRWWSR